MSGADLNDTRQEKGPEGVAEELAKARRFKRKPNGAHSANSAGGGAARYKFKLIPLRDIKPSLSGEWRVKGLLPGRGLAVFYGLPGCGKSFTALALVLCVAVGADYAGRRVRPCRVIYIAAEGEGGFAKRVVAAREVLKVPEDTPFELITVAPDLGKMDGDAKTLVQDIAAQVGSGEKPGVIVIDTLSRTMGSANENGEGMAAFIANASHIAKNFDCLVIAVHHAGKDASKGMRGWSGLHGATDCEWEIEGEAGKHSVLITKMKDGRDGWTWQFALNEVDIGKDEDGEPVTTCTVGMTSAPVQAAPKAKTRAARPNRSQLAFDDAFNEAMAECGETYAIDRDASATVRAVRVEHVRPRFAKRWAVDESDNRKRQKKLSGAFRGILNNLPQHYRIRSTGEAEWIWSLST